MSARRPPPHGQHFLHDPAVARRIVDALSAEGETVLEIGPGRGALTVPLAALSRRLVAVEIDAALAAALRADPRLGGIEIVTGDILARPLPDWVGGTEDRFLLAGNLPYGITSGVLFALFRAAERIDRAVLMMQREVAERVTAGPGGRTYGIVSVAAALVTERDLLFTVGPGAFAPPPRVESAVVRLTLRPRPLTSGTGAPSFETVMRVVKAAFGQRRKKLRNSLAAGLPQLSGSALAARAAGAGIDLNRRAETLTPEEFIALTAALG